MRVVWLTVNWATELGRLGGKISVRVWSVLDLEVVIFVTQLTDVSPFVFFAWSSVVQMTDDPTGLVVDCANSASFSVLRFSKLE